MEWLNKRAVKCKCGRNQLWVQNTYVAGLVWIVLCWSELSHIGDVSNVHLTLYFCLNECEIVMALFAYHSVFVLYLDLWLYEVQWTISTGNIYISVIPKTLYCSTHPSLLGDAGLLGVGDIHDHASLSHLGQTGLHRKCACIYKHKHDDVIKWKHFPRYWPFVRGIHRSRWIPRTKTSYAELWWFLWSAPE